MEMIANLNDIKWVFENVSGYRISKETGISQSTISRFQTGESKFENMRLSHAITLTNYALSLQKESPAE